MTPPTFGSGGGSCFPEIVVVAPGGTWRAARLLALVGLPFCLEDRRDLARRCVDEQRSQPEGDDSRRSPTLHRVAPLAGTAPLPGQDVGAGLSSWEQQRRGVPPPLLPEGGRVPLIRF